MAIVPNRLRLFSTAVTNDIYEVLDNVTAGTTHTLTERGVGQIVTVKDGTGNAGTYNITVVDALGALIDGQTSDTLNQNYQSRDYYWNGYAWRIK